MKIFVAMGLHYNEWCAIKGFKDRKKCQSFIKSCKHQKVSFINHGEYSSLVEEFYVHRKRRYSEVCIKSIEVEE